MANPATKTPQEIARGALRDVNDRLSEAERLLQEFLDRFRWMTEHEDYFERVRKFLG
jgi:hypothetical protein